MTDLEPILLLWQELRKSGTEYVLGTVVAVEGSGYRKPGARILIAADGRRAGTISGGCLEGDVARRAFWHTEAGPIVRRYSTAPEDGDVPYGMGCGGVVHLLLERSATADGVLARLNSQFSAREAFAIATVLDGGQIARRACWPEEETHPEVVAGADEQDRALAFLAFKGWDERRSFSQQIEAPDGKTVTVNVEWMAARPGLFVFGAGDDAIPLVRQARQLGWYVEVHDGRSNLATRARFPEAEAVGVLSADSDLRLDLRPTDAAVVMTHSLEQDTRFLEMLLGRQAGYIGVLGPRRRTNEMLLALARDSGLAEERAEEQAGEWMKRLSSPTGLDLGGDTPAAIALSILAEIQLTIHGASGKPLREVRTFAGEQEAVTKS